MTAVQEAIFTDTPGGRAVWAVLRDYFCVPEEQIKGETPLESIGIFPRTSAVFDLVAKTESTIGSHVLPLEVPEASLRTIASFIIWVQQEYPYYLDK